MPLTHDVPAHEHYLKAFGEVDRAGKKIFRCTREFKRGGCPFSTKNLEIVSAINTPQESK